MKKYKIAILVLLAVFVLYAAFVTVDCVRLRNGAGLKPIITVAEEITDTRTTYTGLGYTICYYTDIGDITEENGMTYIEQLGYGAEFRLFGSILVWAWVE